MRDVDDIYAHFFTEDWPTQSPCSQVTHIINESAKEEEKKGLKLSLSLWLKGYIAHVYRLDPCTGFCECIPTV